MNNQEIIEQLVDGGLHERSVEGLLEHHRKMKIHLQTGDHEASGAHVGKFCENIANILNDLFLGGPESNPEVGTVVDTITSQNNEVNEPQSIRLTLTRILRATYEIRTRRNNHVNLEVTVNHSDTQTAVRLCNWMLAELIRVYGLPDDMDEITDNITEENEQKLERASKEIETLADPNYQSIDKFEDRMLVASDSLTLEEEILALLYGDDGKMTVEKIVKSIPDIQAVSVRSRLSKMQNDRKIIYENKEAQLTSLGAKKAKDVIRKIEEELNE